MVGGADRRGVRDPGPGRRLEPFDVDRTAVQTGEHAQQVLERAEREASPRGREVRVVPVGGASLDVMSDVGQHRAARSAPAARLAVDRRAERR